MFVCRDGFMKTYITGSSEPNSYATTATLWHQDAGGNLRADRKRNRRSGEGRKNFRSSGAVSNGVDLNGMGAGPEFEISCRDRESVIRSVGRPGAHQVFTRLIGDRREGEFFVYEDLYLEGLSGSRRIIGPPGNSSLIGDIDGSAQQGAGVPKSSNGRNHTEQGQFCGRFGKDGMQKTCRD